MIGWTTGPQNSELVTNSRVKRGQPLSALVSTRNVELLDSPRGNTNFDQTPK
jgi:hypothetical protein